MSLTGILHSNLIVSEIVQRNGPEAQRREFRHASRQAICAAVWH
jgi:hypothetical protein